MEDGAHNGGGGDADDADDDDDADDADERTTISQKKSKTTEAVANRRVDADAPRGENEDQKKRRRKKTSKCIKYVKNGMRHTTLSRRKDVYSERNVRAS